MSSISRLRRKLSDEPARDTGRKLQRLECQLAFAKAFVEAGLGGTQSAVDLAQRTVDAFRGGDLDRLLSEVESYLTPVSQDAKTFTIHCVSHGHIDMNWMWSWPETVAATHDTFASVLSLMDQFPQLTYSQSQASVYDLVRRYHPDMFERIKERVREGRWEVTAAHWVEGDKNIVHGESLTHHMLYTRKFFKEHFGLNPEDVPVDWEPDTFGHANTIPSILAQGGVKYYYCCRPGGGHSHPRVGDPRPPVFWWVGPDGARVLVNRETTWYNSYVNIGENYALPMVEFSVKTGLKDWLNIYGIGNHGGGPTRVEIEYFIETQGWPCWPKVEFSTATNWFRKVEADIDFRKIEIPVIEQELNYEFTGCYTSQSAIKKANRFGENYCLEAEALSAIAEVCARSPKSTDKVREAWLPVLFNQFHDILPGSGVAATREHALGLFQETGAITGALKRNALMALAKSINTAALLPSTPEGDEERELMREGRANTPFVAGAGQGAGLSGFSRASGGGRRFFPVLVYNPCSWDRTEIVETHLYDIDIDAHRIVARDEKGRCVPTTITYNALRWDQDWGHRRTSLMFTAENVPAMGYKVFMLCEGEPTSDMPAIKADGEAAFETPTLQLRLDRYRAGLRSVLLKGLDLDFALEAPIGDWQFVNEISRGMTSWVLGEEGEATPLLARGYQAHAGSRNEGNNTPAGGVPLVRTVHELEVPGRKSKVRVTTLIGGHAPRVDFEAEIDWREIGTREEGIPGLRLKFDTMADGEDPMFSTPFGHVRRDRERHLEVPSLNYAHTSFETIPWPYFGVTVLQDSKYGHFTDGDGLGFRVLRASYDPDHAPEVAKSTLRYSVVFHQEKPTPAELTRLGSAFNHPFIVMPINLQEGSGPTTRSFVRVLTEGVVLTTVKAGENGGMVLRLVEHNGQDVEAQVELDPAIGAAFIDAQVCDALERPLGKSPMIERNILKVRVKANSFTTVLLT